MRTKTLLACGMVGDPLFVFVFLAEGATRAGYDPLHHPVSSLVLGDSGWTQTANFLVAGLLTLAQNTGERLRKYRAAFAWQRSRVRVSPGPPLEFLKK